MPGPLLVLVHGRTGNLKLLEWYSKRFEISELSYLLIEAPFLDQRPDQKEPGYSWYLKDRSGIDESREKLLKLVEEMELKGFKSTHIFWMGFSQGSAMILDLALRTDKIFGGFLCISGLCVQAEAYPSAFGPHAKDQNILITHGSRDEIISLEEAEKTYQILKTERVPYEFKVFDKPHSFHLKEEVPYLEEKLKGWVRDLHL